MEVRARSGGDRDRGGPEDEPRRAAQAHRHRSAAPTLGSAVARSWGDRDPSCAFRRVPVKIHVPAEPSFRERDDPGGTGPPRVARAALARNPPSPAPGEPGPRLLPLLPGPAPRPG